MKVALSFLAILFFSELIASPSAARLAEATDLPSVNESEEAVVDIDQNGHSQTVIDRVIRINNDEGREHESVQVIDFNQRSSSLRVLLAETINGETHRVVSKDNIEFKAVGDFVHGFDAQMRAKITFPDVKSGSRLHFKFLIRVNEVPNEGFYSFLADFNGNYLEHYRISFRSVLPLHSWKQDPLGQLKIDQSQIGSRSTLVVQTTAPIRLQTVHEENPFIRAARSTVFGVSTLRDWAQYAAPTIVKQERLLAAKLPPLLENIRTQVVNESLGANTRTAEGSPKLLSVDQLDRVHALVSENFRYFGDWRRRNGGFVPRSLAEISETRYGDCKDLSLVLTALYRSLGYKADLIWTFRSEPQLLPEASWFQNPIDWFNHAITRVQIDERVYWIDGTNPVANAALVPADLAGKPAFVMSPQKPRLEFIARLNSTSSSYSKILTYRHQAEDSLSVQGELGLAGRAAINLAISRVYKPFATLQYELIHALSYGHRIRDSWVGDFAPSSRMVRDSGFQFRFELLDFGVRTSSGTGFFLSREGPVDRLLEETRGRFSDIYTYETPAIWNSEERLLGLKKIGSRDLDCDIVSPWAVASRRVSESRDGVVIKDRFELLTNVVASEELQTPRYLEFQAALRKCLYREMLIVEPSTTSSSEKH